MPPSPGLRSSSSGDTMKDSILRESTAGWSNAISPLRISKRDSGTAVTSSGNEPAVPSKGLARRQSNSYKHVWNNNLVSKSPFKSQIPTPSRHPSRSPIPFNVNGSPRTPRKISGEKRPRPDSLVRQAEAENEQRTRELGFKRRQSKGFQGIIEKEPVTKSPFRRIVSPTPASDAIAPISITLPHTSTMEDDTTSLEEDENDNGKDDMFSDSPPATSVKVIPPMRPHTSQSPHYSPSLNPEQRKSPMRASPLPSAQQASPTRPSLVSKRLMGPRSLSNSPSDTPTRRERRKTVTFDERCDVLEFDRESHENVTFETDDEDVYGPPDKPSRNNKDAPRESISFDSLTDHSITPTLSPVHSLLDGTGIGDDSISGLVDSILQEASATHSPEPSTPPSHSTSFTLSHDLDLANGGEEGGVPHGRTHHAERTRVHASHFQQQQFHVQRTGSPDTAHLGDTDDEPSFSLISLSTPPHQQQPLTRSQHAPVTLPPDMERVEDGMPLGRSHRAERIRQARKGDEDETIEDDVKMLPPSPSPLKSTNEQGEAELPHIIVPKFDIGINLQQTRSQSTRRQSSFDDLIDVFNLSGRANDPIELGLDFDLSVLSNTSIASFHEVLPQLNIQPIGDELVSKEDIESSADENKEDPSREGITRLSVGHSDVSLSHIDISSGGTKSGGSDKHEHQRLSAGNSVGSSESEVGRGDHLFSGEDQSIDRNHGHEFGATLSQQSASVPTATFSSPESGGSQSQPSMEPPLPSTMSLEVTNSDSASSLGQAASLKSTGSHGSFGSAGRSPRINREDVRRRLVEQRSLESPQGSPSINGSSPPLLRGEVQAASNIQSPTPLSLALRAPNGPAHGPDRAQSGRSPIGERLKQALSPPAKPSPAHSQSQSVEKSPSSPAIPVRANTCDFGLTPVFDFGQPGVDIGDMRSALDRLVDDVNTARADKDAPGNKCGVLNGDISMGDTELGSDDDCDIDEDPVAKAEPIERASTAPTLSLPSDFNPSFDVGSRIPSNGSIPPPPPPKDNARNAREERDELIKQKRREARARESGEFIPPRRDASGMLMGDKTSGRPSGRRSLSTGDAEDLRSTQASSQRRVSVLKNQLGGVLGIPLESAEDPLTDSIERELSKYEASNKTYHLREHKTIYASSSAEESVSHMNRVGDLDSGKAWRAVRRPSDMNEYSRQIKEYQSQVKPGKAHGKVFVKVLGVKSLIVPIPSHNTQFTCTLNNGIHFVTTPESRLTRDSKIEQEFELIEHGKLEFTLTLKVRRDPHIIAQFKAMTTAPPPQPPQIVTVAHSKGGMRSFFGATPKKPKQAPRVAPRAATPPVTPRIEENLARYLKPDGTLARAFISFKDISARCDTRLFETSYQLIGQRLEGAGGTMSPMQIGEIVLQVFRLPPLPNIPQDQLPQSLEECHRGLRHINWHKVTYHEGTLTQLGGDCTTWRRRRLRIIGANLVAFNDVTKRATATIDLKKAIAVEDDQDIRGNDPLSPMSTHGQRDIDEFDGLYGVERSFRLIFRHKQEIAFFADTDEEKSKWLEVLRALVGRIPPNPLWAELIWQRQDELTKNTSKPPAVPPSQAKEPVRRQR